GQRPEDLGRIGGVCLLPWWDHRGDAAGQPHQRTARRALRGPRTSAGYCPETREPPARTTQPTRTSHRPQWPAPESPRRANEETGGAVREPGSATTAGGRAQSIGSAGAIDRPLVGQASRQDRLGLRRTTTVLIRRSGSAAGLGFVSTTVQQ